MKSFRKYFELTAWIVALVLLAFMDPATNSHYSFCFFKLMGFKYCHGCGLGHSISYFFHGNLKESLNAHPLGLLAITIILTRIYKLSSLHILPHLKKYNYGQQL